MSGPTERRWQGFSQSAAGGGHVFVEMDESAQRDSLIEIIRREGVNDASVLESMRRVDRKAFVPRQCRDQAYENIPLAIGQGQTISQPLVVGLMTQALDLQGDSKVLEVGTGSGYQTAILAELAGSVISVETSATIRRNVSPPAWEGRTVSRMLA